MDANEHPRIARVAPFGVGHQVQPRRARALHVALRRRGASFGIERSGGKRRRAHRIVVLGSMRRDAHRTRASPIATDCSRFETETTTIEPASGPRMKTGGTGRPSIMLRVMRATGLLH